MADVLKNDLAEVDTGEDAEEQSAWVVLDRASPTLIRAIGVITLLSMDAHAEPHQIDSADLAVDLLNEVKQAIERAQQLIHSSQALHLPLTAQLVQQIHDLQAPISQAQAFVTSLSSIAYGSSSRGSEPLEPR
jgi:hypothetical protein